MPSVREQLLSVLNGVRDVLAQPGDGALDFRPTTVTLREVTWSGGRLNVGRATINDTPITPKPRVKTLTAREIAGSGGRYVAGDVRIGPITPSFPSDVLNPGDPAGGYTAAQLSAFRATPGTDVFLVLSGQMSGEYAIIGEDFSQMTKLFIVARSRRTTPTTG